MTRQQKFLVKSLGDVFFPSIRENDQLPIRSRDRRLIVARAASGRRVGFITKSQMRSMKTPSAGATSLDGLVGRPTFGAFWTEVGAMVIPDLDRMLDNDLVATSV